jgi:preprotein translocase SecE subunit
VNRAVRRAQRAAEAKQKAGATRAPARTGLPKGGTGQRTQRAERGVRRIVPRFALDIWSELTKVVWPPREDVLNMAIVVCIVTIIFGAILGGIDVAFGWLIDQLLLDQDAILR